MKRYHIDYLLLLKLQPLRNKKRFFFNPFKIQSKMVLLVRSSERVSDRAFKAFNACRKTFTIQGQEFKETIDIVDFTRKYDLIIFEGVARYAANYLLINAKEIVFCEHRGLEIFMNNNVLPHEKDKGRIKMFDESEVKVL